MTSVEFTVTEDSPLFKQIVEKAGGKVGNGVLTVTNSLQLEQLTITMQVEDCDPVTLTLDMYEGMSVRYEGLKFSFTTKWWVEQ